MNDQLQELAYQAEDYADSIVDQGGEFHPAYTQKLAELIVRECEKVAKNPEWYGESPSNGWRNPIRHVCNVMKEHFGVK